MLTDHKVVATVQKQGLEVATYAAYDYESFLNMFVVNDYEQLRYVRVENKELKIKTVGELKKYCKERLEEITKPHWLEENQITIDEWIKAIKDYEKE